MMHNARTIISKNRIKLNEQVCFVKFILHTDSSLNLTCIHAYLFVMESDDEHFDL